MQENVNNKIIPTVYTIGYSPHSPDDFLCILQKYAVTVLADVRSAHYSSYRQEFNYRNLKKILPEQGIRYVFLGRELGAQRGGPTQSPIKKSPASRAKPLTVAERVGFEPTCPGQGATRFRVGRVTAGLRYLSGIGDKA